MTQTRRPRPDHSRDSIDHRRHGNGSEGSAARSGPGLDRRRFVTAVAALGTVGLAGCSGDDDDQAAAGGGTDDPTTEPAASSPTETDAETAPSTDAGSQAIYTVPASYEFEGEGTIESDGETYDATLAGVWVDGDLGYTWNMDLPQGSGELGIYIVDGVYYVTQAGNCSSGEDYQYDLQAGFIEDHPEAFYDVQPDETTDYDGEPVEVYSFSYEELPDRYDEIDDGSLTLYVSTESGYVVAEELVTVTNSDDAANYDLTLEFFSFDEDLDVGLPADC